jgi:hypothetical protein
MSNQGTLRAAFVGVGFLLTCGAAFAQDAASAGALFDKGVANMQAGHFDVACPAIERASA